MSIIQTVVSAFSANWEYWVFTQSCAFHQAIDWSIYTFKLLQLHMFLTQRSIKWAFLYRRNCCAFYFPFIKGRSFSSVCRVECVVRFLWFRLFIDYINVDHIFEIIDLTKGSYNMTCLWMYSWHVKYIYDECIRFSAVLFCQQRPCRLFLVFI